MKAKIFAKLKQEYSALGLGDEVLMSRAAALADTGLVTDENIDAVVAVQRRDLEGLQKFADKRVSSALDKERKKREDEETQKKEEEAKAAEEAKKKADAEAAAKDAEKAAKKAAEEAAARKSAEEAAKTAAEKTAAEEAAKKSAEEEARLTEIAQKDEIIGKLSERINALTNQFGEFVAEGKRKDDAYSDTLKKLKESKAQLEERLKTLADESAAIKDAKAKAERKAKIEAKAKELGVPEWRINEGFIIEEDASDETISGILAMAANNINTHLLPGSKGFDPLLGAKPTDEEISKLAASLVK